jgi:hypothetical protein
MITNAFVFLHIYKTRTGYELVASNSQDISQSSAVINSWDNFPTKAAAKKAARELKTTGSFQGSIPLLGWIQYHNF